jgi:hypothetical protein
MAAIHTERPDQPDVAALLEEADAHSAVLYEDDSQFLVYADSLSQPHVRFFVARQDGRAIGCGGAAAVCRYGARRIVPRDPSDVASLNLGRSGSAAAGSASRSWPRLGSPIPTSS